MTLLALMYHRARAGRDGNSAEMLDAHFGHIAANHRNVLPGESLTPGGINVCLVFDDAYFDFYHVVFPLLQKHDLRALLAVPPLVIRERTDAATAARLGLSCAEAFAHPSKGGFCTWPELEQMAASGHVGIAAHGFSHCRLDLPGVDLDTEIHTPQTILGSRLAQPVESFVFPFGKFSRAAVAQAQQRYRYVFRIGGAINRGWDNGMLYRVAADAMPDPWAPFSPARLAAGGVRFFWNRARFR